MLQSGKNIIKNVSARNKKQNLNNKIKLIIKIVITYINSSFKLYYGTNYLNGLDGNILFLNQCDGSE